MLLCVSEEMAEGNYQTGYVADFDPPLEKKHECPICLHAVRDPIQTACGHRFCASCIKQILRKRCPRCPLDYEQLNQDEIFPDNFCKREVLNLTVRCCNKATGCSWLGSLRELENHTMSCSFTRICCLNEGCQVTFPCRDLAHHQKQDCSFQSVHRTNCGSTTPISQQRGHICPGSEIEFKNGCSTKLKRREVEFLMSSLSGLNQRQLEHGRIIQELCQQIEDLPELQQNETLIHELREILAALAELRQVVEVKQHSRLTGGESSLSSKQQQMDVSFEQQHTAFQGEVTGMERRLATEKSVTVKDNALAERDVRLLSLEMTHYDGILRWKITEVNRRRSEALAGRRLSFYSPPFFTSRNGYKMCARIYLNGDGMGKGSHLSLFFVIMKGEYDALLPWPFRQRITFTLVDQDYGHHVSDTFQPDPASSSFQRPVNDVNVASGCPLFVPLGLLETQGYIKNDTMHVKLVVDTRGLVIL